jgi:tetratricopeptide (TPR) repeat protein
MPPTGDGFVEDRSGPGEAGAIQDLFAKATDEHQAGHLQEAGQLYRQVLAADATHAQSLYGLGFLALQQKDYEAATRRMQQAVVAKPKEARFHLGLGNAFRGLGQFEQALAAYRKALALEPNFAEAYSNIAGVLQAAGKLGDAEAHYERALAIQPDYVAAHFNLGMVRQGLGNLEGASACFRRVLELRPGFAEAHNSLGVILRRQDRLEEAKVRYELALAERPDYADAYSNLGVLLRQMGKFDDSAKCLTKALSLRPNSAGVLDNLGNTLRDLGRLEESAACHERAIALLPNSVNAYNNLGYTRRKQGKLKEARESFKRARALDPASADVRWNLSLLDLLEGDFAEGWRGYESRHDRKESRPRSFAKPIWRGKPLQLQGARILLHSEQGFGDSIQFVRYVPMVQAAGGTVILNVPSSLRRLVEAMPGVGALTVEGDPLPEFEWHCPLLSLPLALKTAVDTIPSKVPYLKVPEGALEAALQLTWPDRKLRVGVVWSGNPKCTEDQTRSVPLASFEPLLSLGGVQFFSLQMGAAAESLDPMRWAMTDLRPAIRDFADTAALMQQLDLVLTVDTAVAHLAGALAKPTWLLLPFAPDWRWLLDREDSPWYPTMRIFRQKRPGDWQEVIERVRRELCSLSASGQETREQGLGITD